MPRKATPSIDAYASVRLTHHVLVQERGEALRRETRKRRPTPECLVIGHAWTEDSGREGGSICMVCQVVRWP